MQAKVTDGERKAAFFGSLNNKYSRCLEPDWCCDNPAIKAHSVQNATALSLIAENGHVSEIRLNFSSEAPAAAFQLVGKNNASTFPGLCGNHDATIFAPIDKKPLNTDDPEQLFLLAYRSVTRELHAIMDGGLRIQGALNFLVEKGQVPSDEASPPIVQATVQLLKSWGMYKYRLKYFDNDLRAHRFKNVKHSVFSIEHEKPVLAASSFFSVKPPKKPGASFPGVCLNVIPISMSKTVVVFSYASAHSGDVRKYISSVILSKGDLKKQRLSEMIVYRAENFFMAPSEVASWSDEKRKAIETAFFASVDADPIQDSRLLLFK